MLRLQSKPAICRIIRIWILLFFKKSISGGWLHIFHLEMSDRKMYMYIYIYMHIIVWQNLPLDFLYSVKSDFWSSEVTVFDYKKSTVKLFGVLRRCFQCQRWCQPRCLKIYHHWMLWPKSKTLERWISFWMAPFWAQCGAYSPPRDQGTYQFWNPNPGDIVQSQNGEPHHDTSTVCFFLSLDDVPSTSLTSQKTLFEGCDWQKTLLNV